MKLRIQQSDKRGHTALSWLDSWHSFSFGDYYDPDNQNFGNLRVFNDDWIDKGKGFGSHPHEEMEIITIVEYGSLAHKDSLGSKGVISSGEVQVMSAGTGIVHSEINNSKVDAGKFFQIWIMPSKSKLKPRYEQRKFEFEKNKLTLVVSGNKAKESLFINQDAKIWMGKFDAEQEKHIKLSEKKKHFVFIISGEAKINNKKLAKRDTAYIEEAKEYMIEFLQESQVIIIEV